MKEPQRLLFVYGTLRADCGDPAHRMLVNHVERIGYGTTPGRLVDLGAYPALVDEVAGDEPERRGKKAGPAADHVRGEVYRLLDPDHLKLVDGYEGREFQRISRPVSIDGMGVVQAWVYVYRGDQAAAADVIPSGEWTGPRK